MTPHEEWYTQSPGSRTVSSSDYHAKCAECAAKDQQLADLIAERDKWQNEVCTAKDHLPVDLEEDSLSVGITKLRDTIKSFQAKLEAAERERDKWKTYYELADTPMNDAARLVLEDTIKDLQAKLEAHAEAEGSVCPEDVGCIEYIKILQAKLETSHADVRALATALQFIEHGHTIDGWKGPNADPLIALAQEVIHGAQTKAKEALTRPTVRKIVEGT